MSSAALDLQKAIHSALASDAALTSMLGGNRIHDHAPANLAFPYVTFGRTTASDWSTCTEGGHEHVFTIHVWSNARGKAQALGILAIIRAALHDADLSLTHHRLVNLRQETDEVRYVADNDVYHGMSRFRAVTEPGI